jgi:serine/threonine protein kinase
VLIKIREERNDSCRLFLSSVTKTLHSLLKYCSLEEPYMLVFEYADYGNLRDFLRDRRPDGAASHLSAMDLLKFAHQIAAGMQFLGSHRVVHRDLARCVHY